MDTTFMIGFLIRSGASDDDVKRYFSALRRAQIDVDLEPERYKHYLLDEVPDVYKGLLDTRLCGIGERIVFEPYTREMYETTHRWMVGHKLFEGVESIPSDYELAVI